MTINKIQLVSIVVWILALVASITSESNIPYLFMNLGMIVFVSEHLLNIKKHFEIKKTFDVSKDSKLHYYSTAFVYNFLVFAPLVYIVINMYHKPLEAAVCYSACLFISMHFSILSVLSTLVYNTRKNLGKKGVKDLMLCKNGVCITGICIALLTINSLGTLNALLGEDAVYSLVQLLVIGTLQALVVMCLIPTYTLIYAFFDLKNNELV